MIKYAVCIALFHNVPATTDIYTLSLHDALPIWFHRVFLTMCGGSARRTAKPDFTRRSPHSGGRRRSGRSEEHTSELQSHSDLVCRLLLEKKKIIQQSTSNTYHSHLGSPHIHRVI